MPSNNGAPALVARSLRLSVAAAAGASLFVATGACFFEQAPSDSASTRKVIIVFVGELIATPSTGLQPLAFVIDYSLLSIA
jgi:hypothetical protein